MCYNEKNNSIVPVVELDTIKASDAFGPGSSPGGHTKKTDLSVFFYACQPPCEAQPRGLLRGVG